MYAQECLKRTAECARLRGTYAGSYDPMRATTTKCERIDRWTKMRRSHVLFSGPEASSHMHSSAGFIIIIII
jgi:hypothetical protein